MTKVIGTSLMILLLVMGALFSGLPIYATTEGGGEGNESSGEGGGSNEGSSDEEGTESNPEPESKPEPESETPPAEPEPEPETPPVVDKVPETEPQPATTTLPTCDGSAQDCVTDNGDICLKGQGGHECECSDDMSDCPKHPSVQNEPIHPCLLDPSDPVCPKPDPITQDCPEGYAQNEDGNCFLLHPQGCPTGYHGHEDDETGRCIPNSTPCDPGYEFNEGHTNCEKEHFTCDGKPSVVECKDNNHNGNHNNKDHDKKIIIVKKIIKNIDIIHKIDNANSDGDLDVSQTIVAINYNEGAGINCVFDNDDNGQCETFDVNKDTGKEPLLQIIDFS
jgi:hypothetical protein